MANNKIIFLTGFSGSGKSTIGPNLAQKLKFNFIDIDSEIERQEGLAIADIFAKQGNRAFRKIEESFIDNMIISLKNNTVVSLGGGALINKSVRGSVRQNGLLIYLSCSVSQLYKRLKETNNRPLLAKSKKSLSRVEQLTDIKKLLTQRLPGYKEAHLTISTSARTKREVVSELIGKIKKSGYLK